MVSETDPAAVAHALRAGDLDVALVHEYDLVPEPPEPGLATRQLYGEAMYLAGPAPATAADPGSFPGAADPGAPPPAAPGRTRCCARTGTIPGSPPPPVPSATP
ncbi:hypothetical protein SLAVM298S_03442 [Streptomyces lavendulae subsp. lavendulae]